MDGYTRIWEHWKQSGKSIEEYIDWLVSEPLSFLEFQRTAYHYRVLYRARVKRGDGHRRIIKQRPFDKHELELLNAVYERFGKHYGWFKIRKGKVTT